MECKALIKAKEELLWGKEETVSKHGHINWIELLFGTIPPINFQKQIPPQKSTLVRPQKGLSFEQRLMETL